MLHLRMIGMAIMALLIFLIFFAGLQKRKRQRRHLPAIGNFDILEKDYGSVINIRKVTGDDDDLDDTQSIKIINETAVEDEEDLPQQTVQETATSPQVDPEQIIILHLMAKSGSVFAGYEILQALLSAGMRFGEMNIFHRFEDRNGKGRILFSLASATEPGYFDIQKMGATSCTGLTLFMQLTGTAQDKQSFVLMIEAIEQLSSDLNGIVCGPDHQPLTEEVYRRYRNLIRDNKPAEMELATCE